MGFAEHYKLLRGNKGVNMNTRSPPASESLIDPLVCAYRARFLATPAATEEIKSGVRRSGSLVSSPPPVLDGHRAAPDTANLTCDI